MQLLKKVYHRSGILLFTILTACYFYIGCFDSTFYSIEIILLPIVLASVALLVGLLVWFISDLRKYGITIFTSLSTLCLLFLISEHYYRTYEPNLNIYIPEGFNGRVHLFPSFTETSDVWITEYGIGYIPNHGGYHHNVYQGGENITDALNESGSGNLIRYNVDSTNYESITVSCFEVVKNKKYSKTPWNQKHAICMSIIEFDSLIELAIIDSTLIDIEKWRVKKHLVKG